MLSGPQIPCQTPMGKIIMTLGGSSRIIILMLKYLLLKDCHISLMWGITIAIVNMSVIMEWIPELEIKSMANFIIHISMIKIGLLKIYLATTKHLVSINSF